MNEAHLIETALRLATEPRSGDIYPYERIAEAWAKENANLRIALCGHVGDYNLPDWDAVQWDRGRLTYAGNKTTNKECIWYSPACLKPDHAQPDMFSDRAPDPHQEAML